MTLLDPSIAGAFLAQYKRLLAAVAGKPLKDTHAYNAARNMLYKDGFNDRHIFDSSYEDSFIRAVKNATHGAFIYAKKYRHGYALKTPGNTWLCVKALTTPLEDMIPEWIVVDTAILPYRGVFVCDGLIVNRQTHIVRT